MSTILTFNVTLSLPPTVNHYWGQRGWRKWLGKDAKQFRKDTAAAVAEWQAKNPGHGMPWDVPLRMEVAFFMRDKRRADLDNRIKPLWDSLQHAGVYEDDSQIFKLDAAKHFPTTEFKAVSLVAVQPLA